MEKVFFFSGVHDTVKDDILLASGFQQGILPFRYLGVPLCAKRMSVTQYQVLIDKMVRKISDWKNKFLSYGGRLQLVQSILFSIQNYWSQIFLLPKRVMLAIESLCRKFLWAGDLSQTKKSLISWNSICRPKAEGGLGLIHLPSWNKANFIKLLWDVHKKADKLWIKWIHSYYIREYSIMDISSPSDASFFVRKLLKVRDLIIHSNQMTIFDNSLFVKSKAYVSFDRPFPWYHGENSY